MGYEAGFYEDRGRFEEYGEPSHYDAQAEERSNGERRHEHSSREREKTRDRDRDRDRDRERDRDRDRDKGRHKDHKREDRDRDRDREDHKREDRDRDRDFERHGGREHGRRNTEYDDGYEQEREKRHKHHSHSHSRGRSSHRSRSRSRSHSRERRRRASGFDMAPAGAAVVPGAAMPGQMPGMATPVAGLFSPMFPFGGGTQFAGLPSMPAQAMTQQATRHARRVYVGGLPPMANEQTIATFFSQVMDAIGGKSAVPGDAVVNVYINHEKKFAFVEMRTVEEASNAMALDGIIFEGVPVRVRRPSDYNPSMAATLGPSQPKPNLNLAAVGLTPGAAGSADGPDRVFVGGLPYYLTEIQIKELLESFGPLRGFDLVKDRDTGNSKGYAFCVYQDPSVTDVACAALNGLKMGDKTLTVRRATANVQNAQAKPDQASVLAHAQQQIAFQVIQKMALQATLANPLGMMGYPNALMGGMDPGGFSFAETPTKVVCLTQVVSPDELKNDEDFEDIFEDMKEECGKYGAITTLVIPRPSPTGEHVPGLGKVFVEYNDTQGAAKAKNALNGRKFSGNSVLAVYYSEEQFAAGDYSG